MNRTNPPGHAGSRRVRYPWNMVPRYPPGPVSGRRLFLVAALTAIVMAGCVSFREQLTPRRYAAIVARRLPDATPEELAAPWTVSPEMAAWARDVTRGAVDSRQRLELLVRALTDPGRPPIVYDRHVTGTAREGWRWRRGDCLTMTNLFVGLARAVGLDVTFVEVVGFGEESREGDLAVQHRHIAAAWGRGTTVTVVDFSELRGRYAHYRRLTDLEAAARFRNTLGYQALRKGHLEEAVRHFRAALALDPRLAWAANNLGVALRRLGRLDEAEAAYRRALALDPHYVAALANLARLERERGNEAAARLLEEEAERWRRIRERGIRPALPPSNPPRNP